MTLRSQSFTEIIFLSVALVLSILLSACTDKTADRNQTGKVAAVDLFHADLADARVLVFTKTLGWRHDSIPAGIAALEGLAKTYGFATVATEDASQFNDANLRQFNAIVFLNTSLNVLDEDQEVAMERFIQAGGGFVGIHAAADTEWEGDWHWYRKLVGGVFKSHPNEPSNVQQARLNVIDPQHSATGDLPETFHLTDEWYDYRDLYPFRKDLLTLDEKSYIGGLHGEYHPITWYHEFDGGRSFYTGLGHTVEIYSNDKFLALLTKGLRYAVGGKPVLDYGRARPENNRFVKKTLAEGLNEPMSFDFFPGGDVIIAERPGSLKRIEVATGKISEAGDIPVAYHSHDELGLLGIALDWQFAQTQWLYLTYNHQDENGQLWQRLARFNWSGDKIDNASEKILLSYKIDSNCCHTGGDMHWGQNGELFVSTGDNTNPHEQQGYAPIDFREGNTRNDALRGAGNTQDMRGKILRIIPQTDGSYTIPKGNLFNNPEEGLPEIYVMGARNPFTITYDKTDKALYYGDVGPDAGQSSKERGTRGHDEYNRVTAAGNFGWPLFTGNNQPYVDYDFATGESGRLFNPLQPENESPRNTGAKILPPAQPAMIWYPYGVSEEFPELGSGGRMAVVADVYRSGEYPASQHRYPEYYDGKLFILEAMRGWVKAVSMDEFGRVKKIEPFAPQLSYVLPTDARFSPDGSLHVLEYGRAWFTGNPDARLTRVEFVGADNRAPEPVITLAERQGAAPLQVRAFARDSVDPDGDNMTFRWALVRPGQASETLGSDSEISLTLADAGHYLLRLTATDDKGASASTDTEINVGNAPAEIEIQLSDNTSFYWPDTRTLEYAVTIHDKEDGVVSAQTGDASLVQIDFAFTPAQSPVPMAGHQTAGLEIIGKDLVAANACTACHQIEALSVGPAFRAVADRYKTNPDGLKYLVGKIGTGGSGAWGSNNMPAYSHLSEADRTALASYVLSLATEEKPVGLPLTGSLSLTEHSFNAEHFSGAEIPRRIINEHYQLSVNYTDKGGAGMGPIQAQRILRLIPARLMLHEVWSGSVEGFAQDRYKDRDTVRAESGSGQWRIFPIGEYDLSGIKALLLGHWIAKNNVRWEIEIRTGSADGEVVAHGEASAFETYHRFVLPIKGEQGKQALYIAVRSVNQTASEIHLLDVAFQK